MKIGIVVPHIFMHEKILPQVIFAPATLALSLADGLSALGEEVTLFSPGPVHTSARNVTADLSLFEHELELRGDTYVDLLKKHPLTFISLARQVQSEIIAQAFAMANAGELDIVHIYTNEEDLALPFAALCTKPVVFTHHDPFNFLVKYRSLFPKYPHLPWISMSYAQRAGMPEATHWVGNIYHGIENTNPLNPPYQGEGNARENLTPLIRGAGGLHSNYVAYLGRIIEPKGVHLAIAAVKEYNKSHPDKLTLKIAGKHYAGHGKESYWRDKIEPHIDGSEIEYVGFIDTDEAKHEFLGNARALIVPSTFDEPFGMVMIEALACGTPIIGLDSGAIPEVVTPEVGIVVPKSTGDEPRTTAALAHALEAIGNIHRADCRKAFEARFTSQRMCEEHLAVYRKIVTPEAP